MAKRGISFSSVIFLILFSTFSFSSLFAISNNVKENDNYRLEGSLLSSNINYALSNKSTADSSNTATTGINTYSNQLEAPGEIDFIGADPASINGSIVVEVTNRTYNSDGSATAEIQVRNVTSLWYKLYVEPQGDVDINFEPITLEDDQGKFLFLPPNGTSSFAYPTLNETITFNEPDAGITFFADNSVESGIGALFLQQLEILSRASSAIPTLPHDEAGAIIEVVKAENEGLGPFIDVGTAIFEGDFSGIMTGMSELGRSTEAIAQLGVAYQELGHDISVSTFKDATTYLRILGLTWYIGEFIGQSLGAASGDGATVKAFDFDGETGGVNLDAEIAVTNGGKSVPVQVSFDASNSYVSGNVQSYSWDFDDGSPIENGEAVDHIFTRPGTYEVGLTITDTEGNTDETSQTVQIFDPRFSVDRQTSYEFDFTAETNDDITGYTWDFGDGNTATGRTANHTYNSIGEYETTLTLSFSDGSTADVSHTIFAGPHPVPVSGTIDSDQTWYASDGKYILDGNVTVAEGATLTIEPGVEVLFENSTRDLDIEGTLIAEGTAQDSIRFYRNGDGYGGNLWFRATSEESVLDYVRLDSLDGSISQGAVTIDGTSSLQLTNSTITGSEESGLHLNDGARPEIRDNIFSQNGGPDIQVYTANSLANIGANEVATISVRGTISTPITWRLNDETRYILDGDVTVTEGATLTIEPNVEVLFEDATADLDIEGTLTAEGTAQDSIRFYHEDDGYGGNLWFRSTSEGSVLDYVRLDRLSGNISQGAVTIDGTSSVRLINSTITGSRLSGLHLDDGARPEIRDNIFSQNGGPDIQVYTANSLANVGDNEVATISVRGTISTPITWRLNDETQYILDGDVTVTEGATLTIDPGVEVLLEHANRDLYIEGTLTAKGTAQDSIRFLPGPDHDSHGGNIHFRATSEESVLDYVRLDSLSGGVSHGAVTIDGTSSVRLTNSTITRSSSSGLHLDDGARPEIRDNNFSQNGGPDIQVYTANSLANIGANEVATISVRGTISTPITWRLNDETRYILDGDVTVTEGATLTIEPNVDVLFETSTRDLDIEGTLIAEGTAQDSIRFYHDGDGYGGNLWFRSTSEGSVLDYVRIDSLDGGTSSGAITIEGTSSVQLTNSTITGSQESGLYLDDGANPNIRRNTFENNQIGLIVSGSSNPDLGTSSDYGQNIFRGNADYSVQNNTTETIQAIGNFWNSTDPSIIDDHIFDDDEDSDSGPVIFEPFLEEAPDFDNDPNQLTITSVEPNPVTGSNSDQPLTVHGSGFEEGAFVILDDLEDDQGAFENPEKTTFVNSSELVRQATFTENAATWSAQVENPDGSRSDTVQFEVQEPSSSIPIAESFAHPVGGGNKILEEHLDPETNPYYPNNPVNSSDINREPTGTGNFWFNFQDVGNFNTNIGGIHAGEDWNYGGIGDDIGSAVYATANGQVIDIRNLSNPASESGYAIIIEHVLPTEETYYSLYLHVVDASSTEGEIVQPSISGEVEKGDMIARLGDITRFGSHLHFEIRNDNWEPTGDLYPNDIGTTAYYSHDQQSAEVMTSSEVADAYQLMQNDGIIDASDFIDAHSSEDSAITPPTGLTATNNNGNIELSWDANTEQHLAGYNLYRSTSLFSDLTGADKINNSSLITEVTYTDDTIEAGTTYYYRLTSVDSNGNESPLSNWVSYVNEALNVSNEWKLVSNPTLQEMNLSDVQAFRFDRTYQRDSVLTAGNGYWIKSNTDKDLAFQDQGIDSIEIALDQGWNMVGSLVDTIHTADIDDPGAVIGSAPVYSYDINSGNYQEATQLFPKKGYWLYAEESGNIQLSFDSNEQNTKEKPSQIAGNEIVFDKIVFEHENSKQQLLYSNNPLNKQRYLLPPVPPQPNLDVRTSGSLKATGADKTSLAISSSTYPVQVSLEKHQDNNVVYQLSAHEGEDKVLLTLTSANSLQIKESYEQISINRISESEVPLENKLLPNYPNPFNPTTTIKYEVANTSNVEIKVYDVLGREVRTLVNQQRQPGVYTTNFNGGDLASGLYFIKINAGQYAKVQKMTLIK